MRLMLIVALGALGACGQSNSAAPADANAAADGSAGGVTSTPTQPPANVSYKAGDNLVTLKDEAQCGETGPNAGDPWELAKGANVKFLKVEGAELRVDSGGGIECLVAPDAVGPG